MNTETAFKYLTDWPDNREVKFPWHEVRLLPYFSYSNHYIVEREELYSRIWIIDLAESCQKGYNKARQKDWAAAFVKDALDPRFDGFLREWMFGQFNNPGMAVAVSKRIDGRFNVSVAKFYRVK